MNTDRLVLPNLAERIAGCGFVVSNALGVGFVERVHENAPAPELREAGMAVRRQQGITERCDGISVGE